MAYSFVPTTYHHTAALSNMCVFQKHSCVVYLYDPVDISAVFSLMNRRYLEKQPQLF